MAGRGAQTFKKRQKEQQRKEKQQEKLAKRLERKPQGLGPIEALDDDSEFQFADRGLEALDLDLKSLDPKP